MTTPAGWHVDDKGATRWWDGSRWGEDSPVAAPSTEFPSVPEGTSTTTVWVWLIVLLPVLSAIATIGYLVQMQQGMFDMLAAVPLDDSSSLDVERLIAAELNAILTPWYLVLTLSGWVIYGLSVWFAALDARQLTARGFDRPFPWVWTFLSSLVYVIGRHVVIRRRGGRTLAPLLVTIAIQVVVLLAASVWASVFVAQTFETVFWMVTTRQM
ncbi:MULTISPECIES: hypothetical protein [Microbacterium]|uniref:DUF2510 domain-containing protein n=1 Tax=Microbacterium maritypicum TaxID=33918 RepID=A0AAJ5VCS5_MICMQ|nr:MULTISPECIES: hypothetical protein [Microbacterium]EYT58566.1 hypothetical protein D514_0113940 [Microbacterium sp. UCD-TDU]WEF21861.1 hypothetical protein PWF71_04065 [Microbacterium liquefaciens]